MKQTRRSHDKRLLRQIGFDEAAADNVSVRTQLVNIIIKVVKYSSLSQKELAQTLRISQPRVSQLLNGKISLFTIDALINFLALLGYTFRLSDNEQKQLTFTVLDNALGS